MASKIVKGIWILLILGAYVFNYYLLKISLFYFTGILLGLLIAVLFVINFIIKIYKKKTGAAQEDYSYCFPDKMAKVMKKMDMRTQMEAGLLSMFFILVGMLAFTVYVIFFAAFSIWFKILTAFNSFWGLVFMVSFLVSQYQSYVTYMQTVEALKTMNPENPFQENNTNVRGF